MKFLLVTLFAMFSLSVSAQETILVVNAQGATQSMTPQILRVIEESNKIQSKYKFVMEFKPGAFESLGIKHMLADSDNRVVTVTNSMAESFDRGFVDVNELVPVFSHGDACWAIITNFGNTLQGLDSIKKSSVKEITVGGPAIGGAAHLAALQIGQKYNIPVRYIVYRSNYDALINMTADDHSVNMVMDRLINYQQMSEKNSKIQALALNCPERLKEFPTVKTLKEQGIVAPYIWHFTVASTKMPGTKRKEIEQIFKKATLGIGKSEMFALSDFISPVFYNLDSQQHYNSSIKLLKDFRSRYSNEIKSPN